MQTRNENNTLKALILISFYRLQAHLERVSNFEPRSLKRLRAPLKNCLYMFARH